MKIKELKIAGSRKNLLLFLLVCILSMSSVSLSRYIIYTDLTQTRSVVTTDVGVTALTFPTENIKVPGDSAELTFEINGQSGMELDYSVSIDTTDNLPINYYVEQEEQDEQNIKNEPITGTLEQGEVSQVFVIRAEWPEDETDLKYAGLADAVKLNVTIEQAK